jgi:hypothetical protein
VAPSTALDRPPSSLSTTFQRRRPPSFLSTEPSAHRDVLHCAGRLLHRSYTPLRGIVLCTGIELRIDEPPIV